MDFTREPIIETVITPKEGCKLVVRSSKSTGQEEYFVDAVEVVSFGYSFFFRSLERPKAFLVPSSDYEILEVRETRMVLKNVGLDRAIKIAGGREGQMRGGRDSLPQEKPEPVPLLEESVSEESSEGTGQAADQKTDGRLDKKRDRRRNYRRRRGRDEPKDGASFEVAEEKIEGPYKEGDAGKVDLPEPKKIEEGEDREATSSSSTSFLTSLLPPPPNLISETIARYKDNALFKQAFYLKEQGEKDEKADEEESPEVKIPLEQPAYGSYEVTEEEEEEIYRQRKKQTLKEEGEETQEEESKEEHEIVLPPLEPQDEISNNNPHS